MGIQRPLYHDPSRATINLTLPWQGIAELIANLNLKIINGRINKPWGFNHFFTGSGYPTHNLEGLVPYPESLALPSMPPPTERTAEDQLFCRVHKHPDDPCERIDVTSGLFSLHAFHLKEHEAVARKTAAALSNALSIAEYVYNQPEVSEESRLGLHQIKLDLVAGYACRSVHNHMLMRHSVVLDNLAKTIPLIDPDQRVALLHAPFRSITLFRGELAKVYRANKEPTSSVTVYPAAPPQSYTTKPYTGRGRSFRKRGSSYRRSSGDRDHSRSAPSSAVTGPSRSGDGQATMTFTFPQEPNKHQVQTHEGASRSKRQCKS